MPRCIVKSLWVAVLVLVQGCMTAGAIVVVPPENTSLGRFDRFVIVANKYSLKADYEVNLFTVSSAITGANQVPPKGDIPRLIQAELEKRGKSVSVSSGDEVLPREAVVVRYVDFWGWDMADILKFLKISFYRGSESEPLVDVAYHQAYGYHGFPTPKRHIPRMMNKVFGDGH